MREMAQSDACYKRVNPAALLAPSEAELFFSQEALGPGVCSCVFSYHLSVTEASMHMQGNRAGGYDDRSGEKSRWLGPGRGQQRSVKGSNSGKR